MERLQERLISARRAVTSLQEVACRTSPSKIERDAAIQRFEYSFEAVWKAAQRYLKTHEAVEIGTPKSCIRASRDAQLLDDRQTESALNMANDRNITSHIYSEEMAEAIFRRLCDHCRLLDLWLSAMEERAKDA